MKVETTAEKMLFTSIKIETRYADGAGAGTGFFFSYDHNDLHYPFIVTNKHVVEGGIGGHLIFTKQGKDGEPLLGEGFLSDIDQEAWQSMWFGHPDPEIDIAVFPLLPIYNHAKNLGVDLFFSHLNSTNIPSDEQLSELNVLEEITFVGYPNGLWDSKNLIPITRRGTTATPLTLDFEGEPKFLIDASVFGGSSGSPVYIANHGTFTLRNGTTHVGSRFYFLGVVAAVYHKNDQNAVVAIPVPTQFQPGVVTQQMIDLGIVFKARTVIETIKAFIATNPA
jgi:hypothetical protein